MHIHTHTYTHARVHMCAHMYLLARTYSHACTCTRVCPCALIHVRTSTCVHAHTGTCTHTPSWGVLLADAPCLLLPGTMCAPCVRDPPGATGSDGWRQEGLGAPSRGRRVSFRRIRQQSPRSHLLTRRHGGDTLIPAVMILPREHRSGSSRCRREGTGMAHGRENRCGAFL